MTNEKNAIQFETSLKSKLELFSDAKSMTSVDEIIEFAKKKEKELGTAEPAEQTIKPGLDDLQSHLVSIDKKLVEEQAGIETLHLVNALEVYTRDLVFKSAMHNPDILYYEEMITPFLDLITEVQTRIAIEEIIIIAKKKENELGVAEPAHQIIKPGIEELNAYINSIDFNHIEIVAGPYVRNLVDDLVNYTQGLYE